MINIVFERETDYGTFRDALHLPEDHNLTDEQIQAMMQERVDNWIAIVSAPPPPIKNDDEYIELNGVTYKRVT